MVAKGRPDDDLMILWPGSGGIVNQLDGRACEEARLTRGEERLFKGEEGGVMTTINLITTRSDSS